MTVVVLLEEVIVTARSVIMAVLPLVVLRSSWPIRSMTLITCAKPSPPRVHSPSWRACFSLLACRDAEQVPDLSGGDQKARCRDEARDHGVAQEIGEEAEPKDAHPDQHHARDQGEQHGSGHQPRRLGELLQKVRRISGILDHFGRIASEIELHWSSHAAPSSASSGNFR